MGSGELEVVEERPEGAFDNLALWKGAGQPIISLCNLNVFLRLRDPCHDVRQIAGLVMTHLILKDMVKVKGQVSEMATLLIDPEEEIVRLAQNFFSELSSKVRRSIAF